MQNRILLVVSLVAGCSSAPAPAPSPPPPTLLEAPPSEPVEARPMAAAPQVASEEASPAEKALQAWSPKSRCSDYDYYPEGGLQNFWCHRGQGFGLEQIRSVVGLSSLFVSGPHRQDVLDLQSATEFGHYDPAFVRWLREHAVSRRGSVGQRATQAAYTTHLAPLARIFWLSHQKMEKEPECAARELKAYAAAIKQKKRGFHERWFFFMNPRFCDRPAHPERWYYNNGMDAGVDGNVTKGVVGFWMRRQMDGTYKEFAAGLRDLLVAYDPDLLSAPLP